MDGMDGSERTKVVIIGGGIVGCAIAWELAKYPLDVTLVEKQPDLAMETTKANSAILHAGFAAKPGTLKAKYNVRGLALYRQWEAALGLEIESVGSLVVARETAEKEQLAELLAWGEANGVPDLALLDREAVLALEPALSPDIAGALWAPGAAVIWPFGAALAFAENAVINGARVLTNCEVRAIATEAGRVTGVDTSRGFFPADLVVNAAGVRADEISRLAGDDSFTITPRKGEYVLFDRAASSQVRHIIFPMPTAVSKGILISTTVHGNMFIGPNARPAAGKDDTATTEAGLAEVIAGAQKLMPDLPLGKAIVEFAGLRAGSDRGDFIIGRSEAVAGLLQAAGIESPGLTAAPAIAERIGELICEQLPELNKRADHRPDNPRSVKFSKLAADEQAALIEQNPQYGRVVCRCELITEGEIVAAIQRPCGARTLDGVKRRAGTGLGRCQGGFCGPRVVLLLARELGVPVTEIVKDAVGSQLFIAKLPGYCEVVKS